MKAVVEAFLADVKGRLKANTFATYKGLLEGFALVHGEAKVEGFTVAKAYAYANGKGSSSHRHNLLGSMATAFKWALSVGLISENPLKNMKRPPKASRGAGASIGPDEIMKLLEASGPALKTLLTLLHETGAQPSELSRLTAEDVDFAASVAILREHKPASTGKPRLIVLTPKAVAILQAQATAHPTGPLLRNSHGNPWDKDAIGHAMRRASKKSGVKAIAYGFRHTYATDALAQGIPEATVAALLGHSSTAMLFKHYSHLTSRTAVLKEAVGRIR